MPNLYDNMKVNKQRERIKEVRRLKDVRTSKGRSRLKKRVAKIKKREEEIKKHGEEKMRRKIQSYISNGNRYVSHNDWKSAFYQYNTARSLSTLPLFEDLHILTEKKRDNLKERVIEYLDDITEKTFRNINKLLNQELFQEILKVSRKYRQFIKKYDWINVDGFIKGFYKVVGSHYEEILIRMVSLADRYFDKEDYEQAGKKFSECKGMVRTFDFSDYRSYLIGIFMRYEMICQGRMTTAKMFELLSKTENLDKNQEISEILFEIGNLEDSIPHQFRDKNRLQLLHTKMNTVREKILSS